MPGKGYDIEEFFRQAFSIHESVDLLTLMDAAITVAAFKHPEELSRRTSGISRSLAIMKARKGESGDANKIHNDQQPKPKRNPRLIIRVPARKSTQSAGVDKKMTPAIPTSKDRLVNVEAKKNSAAAIPKPKGLKNLETMKMAPAFSKSKDTMKLDAKKIKAAEDDHLKLSGTKRKLHERYEQLEKSRRKTQILDVKDLPKVPCESGPMRRRRLV